VIKNDSAVLQTTEPEKARTRQPLRKLLGSLLPFTHVGTLSVKKGTPMHHYGDNFVLVVPEEHPLHTQEYPFCWDETCPCHDDTDAIAGITNAINEGIITADDATHIIKGETV